MTAEELFQSYLNLSPQERFERACAAGSVVMEFLKNESGLSEEDQGSFLFFSIGMFIAADGKLTRGELELFNAIYQANATADEIAKYFSSCADPEFVSNMDKVIDSMPEEPKFALCTVGLCILSSDGELNKEELQLFAKILSK